MGFLGLLFVPKGSLVYWGSKIIGWTVPRLRAMSWEVISMPSCIVVKLQIRSLGISYLIPDGLTLLAVFPLNSVEEEIIK